MESLNLDTASRIIATKKLSPKKLIEVGSWLGIPALWCRILQVGTFSPDELVFIANADKNVGVSEDAAKRLKPHLGTLSSKDLVDFGRKAKNFSIWLEIIRIGKLSPDELITLGHEVDDGGTWNAIARYLEVENK